MSTTFHKLNYGWNAEPNSPEPKAQWSGGNLLVTFLLNPFLYPEFREEDQGQLTFADCSRYRFGRLNDEGWYRGQSRFGGAPHDWGEFYEVRGDLRLGAVPNDWQVRVEPVADRTHFLFYFRDEDFECDAQNWSFSVIKA